MSSGPKRHSTRPYAGTLTNSSQNYDEPVNGSTYTFGSTVSATAFTLQNIVFYKR